MNGQVLTDIYYDIVRNYLRDNAIYDKKLQIMYPNEYRQTMDTYNWIDAYIKNKVMPQLVKIGGVQKQNCVVFNGVTIKKLDDMTKNDFDSIWHHFENKKIKFWQNIPDLCECTKKLEDIFEEKSLEDSKESDETFEMEF